eukprot:765443-Prorocentrum_minimum.AAC.3
MPSAKFPVVWHALKRGAASRMRTFRREYTFYKRISKDCPSLARALGEMLRSRLTLGPESAAAFLFRGTPELQSPG